jgi:hypothetical protein
VLLVVVVTVVTPHSTLLSMVLIVAVLSFDSEMYLMLFSTGLGLCSTVAA